VTMQLRALVRAGDIDQPMCGFELEFLVDFHVEGV
jgi:hypothetical protein